MMAWVLAELSKAALSLPLKTNTHLEEGFLNGHLDGIGKAVSLILLPPPASLTTPAFCKLEITQPLEGHLDVLEKAVESLLRSPRHPTPEHGHVADEHP